MDQEDMIRFMEDLDRDVDVRAGPPVLEIDAIRVRPHPHEFHLYDDA